MSATAEREGGLRERKRATTASRIERTALQLFADHGFDAVSMEQVGRAAGVSRATVFRYFPSKADLLFAGHQRDLATVRQLFTDEPEDGSPVEVAARVALRVARRMDDSRDVLAQRLSVQNAVPELVRMSARNRVAWESLLAHELAERSGCKEPGLAEWVAASSLVGAINSAVILWWRGGRRASLVPVFRRALKALPGPLG